MKRIKYIASLLAIVGIFSAQAAEVDSVNMVGFAKVDVYEGLNIVGVPFINVGDSDVTVSDLFDLTEFVPGTGVDNADSISVWQGSSVGYEKYYLVDYQGYQGLYLVWLKVGDSTYTPQTITLNPGEGIWINRQGSAGQLTVKGEVLSPSTTDISVVTGLNMVSYPYSVASKFSSFDFSNSTPGTGVDNADSISVWQGSSVGYEKYYLVDYQGYQGLYLVWLKVGDSTYTPQDPDLAMAEGFWYNAQSATTVSASKPY